ncbi:MAG TPA: DUF302 domain-containing protein [Thermoanaerobaculia bacterium]|nr:DUF302 domain-containing protein [Thermoanaerobaculia bacterium]
MIEQTRFGTRKTVHRGFDDVLASTKRALADHALHVVSEVDLGAEHRKCTVIGAWNALSAPAVEREPDLGALLPCSVVVYEQGSGGACVVSAADPCNALEVAGPGLLVEQAVLDSAEKLQRVIESV